MSNARHKRWAPGALFALATAIALVPFAAFNGKAAGSQLLRGFADPVFVNGDFNHWLGESRGTGARIARIDVSWREVLGGDRRPKEPRNPADAAYDFSHLDEVIRSAVATGHEVMLTAGQAPSWAEGRKPKDAPPPGTWKPDPQAFGAFGEALATRYSGRFGAGLPSGPLPEVKYFEAWNEPNLHLFLNPLWQGFKKVGAIRYREMVTEFYEGVHAGNRGAKVIAGATAPFGDDGPNAIRIRPLDFMREVLCVRGHRNIKRERCRNPGPAKFDIYSHHPINLFGGPRDSGRDPDDANAVTDIRRMQRILRAAERLNTVRGPKRHRFWVTEIWWESNPPDRRLGHSLDRQSDWMQEAMYLLWKFGVRAALWYQIVDAATGAKGYENLQAGVFFEDGTQKPSWKAVRFPFVTERRGNKNRVTAWTIPPLSGQLHIERYEGGTWRTIETAQVRAGRPFSTDLRLPDAAQLAAEVGGEGSRTWYQSGPRSKKATARARSSAVAPPVGRDLFDSRLEALLESPSSP